MTPVVKIIIIYFITINVIAFGMMGVDKSRARADKWRIPERSLFLSAILGGSIGANLGMRLFRHKTKHMTFVIGMPLILLLQIAAACALIYYF